MKLTVCSVALLLSCIVFFNNDGFGQFRRPVSKNRLPIIKRNLSWQKPAPHNNLKIFGALSCSNDSLVFTRQSQIDSFPISNPACTVIRKLVIDGSNAVPAITNINAFNTITTITDSFQVINTNITSLSAMTSLTQLGVLDIEHNDLFTAIGLNNLTALGSLRLFSLPQLTAVTGISNNLATIDGEVYIDSTAIADLSGFNGITRINGDLTIYHAPITSLSAFNALSVVHYLHIDSDPSLASVGMNNIDSAYGFLFSNLPQLSSIGNISHHLKNKDIGTFWFIQTPLLTSLSGMDSVHTAFNFYIWFDDNLTSLHGIEQLRGDVGGGISLWFNQNLTNITALGNITSTQYDKVEVNENNSLPSLTGLGNINTAAALWITNNPLLTTLSPLNGNLNITGTDPGTLKIFSNPQLAACSFFPVCNYLAISPGSAEIHDNAPGCGSITEIIANCGLITCDTKGSKTWTGSVSADWNDAANWLPNGVPQPCDTVIISGGINQSPLLTTSVTISGITLQPGATMEMNGFTLTVLGNTDINNASITGQGLVVVRKAHDYIDIEHSNISPSLTIQDYTCPLTMLYSSFDNDVVVSDLPARTDVNDFGGNTFNQNFSLTVNATDGNAQTYFDDGADDIISGDASFTLNQPVYLGIGNDGRLEVGGNFTANNNFAGSLDIGSINFVQGQRNDAHIINLGTEPLSFGTLYTGKFGGTVTLDQDVFIRSNAYFTFGAVHTTLDHLLIFVNGATISQFSSGSYVVGPVKKIGNQGFRFPVGDGIYQGVIEITAPATVTDEYIAQYINQNPSAAGFDTSKHASSLKNVSGNEYWKITRVNGNSNVKVSVFYDSTRSGSLSSIYQLRVAKWNGTQWANLGSGAVTGNTFQSTVQALTADSVAGIYTDGFAPLRIPVITIGKLDSVICAGQNFKVPISLDTLAFTNNTFFVQLSDSAGSFANPLIIGAKFTTSSDTIFAFITTDHPNSSHYRIRVVGTIPADTSVNIPTINVQRAPSNSLTITGSSNGCIGGGSNKYYVTPKENGVTYNWTLNGGGNIVSNNDTVLVTWTTTGNHILSVSNSNFCGVGGNANKTISVSPPPPTDTPSVNSIGRWLYASTPAPAQNALGYHWYRNDTLIAGASNASYYAAAQGTFKVRYYNLCGESPVSNSTSFAAASIAQTISFPSIGAKTYGDPAFTPVVTASSGLPVSLAIVSGPASINPVNNLLTITGTGTVIVRATQLGNNVYDTAAPVSTSFTVSLAAQTITFDSIPNSDIALGTTLALNASASSGLTVTYTLVSGPATINGNTLTLTGLGTVVVKTSQAGNTNYLAAADVSRSFCIYAGTLDKISGPNSICPSVISATYSVNDLPGATYQWRIAGGNTLSSTTHTVNITWPGPGTYTLIAKATGPCGQSSANDTLVVTALTSAQPDSVNNMFPVNGAANQQLPLTLSWVPANPQLNYTFDVYLWRSDTAQPALPFASNITTVSYTIPASANILANKTYKWMVVAHNGSCVQINTGPVQQFSLIPLPDLKTQNVLAPATAFSGQTITINWSVKNNGPGNTGTKSWTDAVFLSFDTVPNFNLTPETGAAAWSQLQFPVRPLLIATKSNVSALDSGQQYSNSVNFTLPLNYSAPLYVYVITNYPAGTNAPLQTNYANDTARAPQPINVSLSPTPDLRVDTVFTPATTFTGSTINLTYKVKNYGALTAAGSAWYDKAYISSSPFFDVNNSILLKLPKANDSYYSNALDALLPQNIQLQKDSSYTANVSVVIPNFLPAGSYYIYVVTNATNSLYEGALTNNNVNFKLLQVFLTPTPVLTISSVTVPNTSVSTTQTIGVSWNIKNTGFNDNIEKNKGHYGIRGAACDGGFLITDSLGWGSSYWKDKVYISRDSSLLNLNGALYVGSFLHGGDRNIAQNAGYFSDVPGSFNTCVSNTTDPNSYSINTGNVINPGKDFPTTLNINIPDTLSQGNYYVYVYSNPDKEVFEYPGTAQIRRSNTAISVQRPDLTVNAVTVPASTVGAQPFSIAYTVINNGPGTVFNHVRNDQVFVSTSPVFDGSAIPVATASYNENLPVALGVPHTINYTFPAGTSGTRYIYIRTNYDSSFTENSQSNNTSIAAVTNVIAATPVDLSVASIQLADTVITSTAQRFAYRVTNNGPATTGGNWTDSIFISCNPVFNSATAYFVAKRNHSEVLTTGNGYNDSLDIVLPYSFQINNCFPTAQYGTAYFFVKANADGGMYEGANTGNNTSSSGSRVVKNPLPDHTVVSLLAPDSATVGRSYGITWTVKNIGNNPFNNNYYNDWVDELYVSPDSVFNANAIPLFGFGESNTLNTNQTYTDTKTGTVPVIPAGDYYVLVRTNASNRFIELNADNNAGFARNIAGVAKKIHVTLPLLPDLTDSVINVPATIAVGQPINLVNHITNNGPGVTFPASWADMIWLSTDFIPNNGNDVLLSVKYHNGSLLPSQSYSDTITTNTIPINLPAGNYIVIAQTNATNSVVESNSSNNNSIRYVSVINPSPADLTVENIRKPDSVYLGYTIDTLRYGIFNQSVNTALGVSTDGVYLSKSTLFDTTAQLIGIKNKSILMGPLSHDSITFQPLVTGVTEGNYNLFVKTDIQNNIVETNKNNNTGIATTPIYVKVKPLPLGAVTPNTLQNLARYYKLSIPDSLLGATILVTLKSNDSLTANNQLYIGGGYVPSAAHFDYAYGTPNYGNQQVIISAVTDTAYYITANCISSNPPLQNITLEAKLLPFAILSVESNSGGNSGNVTVKVTGSLLTNNMVARLKKTGTIITATNIYYSNSTTAFVTFNLAAQPLGIYDVELVKPDASTAVLQKGFSVVSSNNGGLITGGGVNTAPGDGTIPGCDPGAAAGLNAQLSVEVVMPASAFGGWPFVIAINYTNPTNNDIPAQTRVLYSKENLPLAFKQEDLATAGSSLYLVLTEKNGPPGIIRAGGSGTILVYCKAPVTFPAHQYANFIIK